MCDIIYNIICINEYVIYIKICIDEYNIMLYFISI